MGFQLVSPSGNDSNDGQTWATAKATRAAAMSALGSGGGTVWLHPDYVESHAGALSIDIPAGMKLRCAADTNEPPTPGGDTARISSGGAMALYGDGEIHGIRFTSGEMIDGAGMNSVHQCRFELGELADAFVRVHRFMGDCWFKFGHASQRMYGKGQIDRGGIDPSGVKVDGLFIASGGQIRVTDNFDATHAADNVKPLADSDEYGCLFMRDVQLPGGLSGESLSMKKINTADMLHEAGGVVTLARVY